MALLFRFQNLDRRSTSILE